MRNAALWAQPVIVVGLGVILLVWPTIGFPRPGTWQHTVWIERNLFFRTLDSEAQRKAWIRMNRFVGVILVAAGVLQIVASLI